MSLSLITAFKPKDVVIRMSSLVKSYLLYCPYLSTTEITVGLVTGLYWTRPVERTSIRKLTRECPLRPGIIDPCVEFDTGYLVIHNRSGP